MNLEKYLINTVTVRKNSHRTSHNEDIAEFYNDLAEETNNDTLFNRSFCVKQCYEFWDVDYYKQQHIKDIKRIQLCKDKFCVNCQNLLANRRENKYQSFLDSLRDRYDIYHVVFTVPNCNKEKLRSTLNLMYKKFPYLIQYLQEKRKTADLNFTHFGYVGAIRALEITQKVTSSGLEFHPHFHCLFILRKGLNKTRHNVNHFSFNGNQKVREFTDTEIFFQKAWYLLYNNIRLNKQNFDSLPEGYSVTAECPRPGHYHQVFKYVLGGLFKKGQTNFSFDIFKTLYSSLYRRKMIQGYGILNKFTFNDEEVEEEVDYAYESIISELQAVENAQTIIMRLQNIKDELETNKYKYISRNTVRREILQYKK